ncbi:MAG: O-antigen ligase family protein [Candidatus Bipolaricaulota bacterium]|nr:MAG: O-antigen ligase family protein [Candidatus Bipolaricaulota bacterium]
MDRVLVYLLAGLAFAMPLLIWPWSSEYGYTKSIFALIAVSLMAISAGIAAWRKGSWQLRVPWLFLPFAALLVVSLLSIVPAINGRVVVQSIAQLATFGVLALIAANRVTTKDDANWILGALLASAVLASLYGLLQHREVMLGGPGTSPLNLMITSMGNRNYLGGFLSYLLFPSVILVLRLRLWWLRALAIVGIAFCFGTAMLVEQSGILIALMAAFVVLVAGWAIFRPVAPLRERRLWLIALLVLIAIVFQFMAPSGPLNSVVGLSSSESSWLTRLFGRSAVTVRTQDWSVGWEMFRSNPVLGVGLGHYKLQYLPYKAQFLASPRGASHLDEAFARAGQAHSEYVQVLAETGALGALSVLGLLAALVMTFWTRLRRAPDEGAQFDLLLLGAGAVAFLVHALVSFPAHLPSSSLVLALVLGLSVSSAYGTSARLRLTLKGWTLRGVVVGVVVLGVAASVFAARDFAADLALVRAQRALQRGDVQAAQEDLRRSIALDFAPRHAHFYLGVTQFSVGDLEAAEASFERCLTRLVTEEVYLYLARTASAQEDWEGSRENIDRLLATHPMGATGREARYLDGVVAFYETDSRRSLEVLAALVEDEPDYTQSYVALYRFNTIVGRAEEAEDYLRRGLAEIARQATEILGSIPTDEGFRIRADEYAELVTRIQTLISILNQIVSYEPGEELAFISLGELFRAGAALEVFPSFDNARMSYERAQAIIENKLVPIEERLTSGEPLDPAERDELTDTRGLLMQRLQAIATILLTIP